MGREAMTVEPAPTPLNLRTLVRMALLALYEQFPFRCFRYDRGRDAPKLAFPKPFTGLLTALRCLPMCGVSGVARQHQFGCLSHVTILRGTTNRLLARPRSASYGWQLVESEEITGI
jgi:hypothetical protein